MRLLLFEYCSIITRLRNASAANGSLGDLAEAGGAILSFLTYAFNGIDGLRLAGADIQNNMTNGLAMQQAIDTFAQALDSCDAALVVAPEWDGILLRLTRLVESMGKTNLGSAAKAVAISQDKNKCMELWRARGLPVPKSILLTSQDMAADALNPPYIIKPNSGAGGEGVMLCTGANSKALQQINLGNKQYDGRYLAQEYIEGEAMSVTCFVEKGTACPISLNRQHMSEDFKCNSVSLLKDDKREHEMYALAALACSAVDGLNGLVGVDMVYGKNGAVLIELNARVTLAFAAFPPEQQKHLAGRLLQNSGKGD